MSFHFDNSYFSRVPTAPVFALIDPTRLVSTPGVSLKQAKTAGIIAQLRRALACARARRCPIAFVRDEPNSPAKDTAWIRGFEPKRQELLFYRNDGSCYSAKYFSDVVDAADGNVVFAGFFRDGCLATATAAFRTGHRAIYLKDAIVDVQAASMNDRTLSLVADLTNTAVQVIPTSAWIKAAEQTQEYRQHLS